MLYSAKTGGRGVNGNLHFSIPSINRLSQIEPVTFSILSCWALFWDYLFLSIALRELISEDFKNLFIHKKGDLQIYVLASQSN
jgi:hypothetical protein